MTALSNIPLNTFTWTSGSLACYVFFYRSYSLYKSSHSNLSKYVTWFAILMGIGQSWLAYPAFFTLDTNTLRYTYIAGEFFIYFSFVAQSAILWFLVLRSRIRLRLITIPVSLISIVSWLYAIPRSKLILQNNFIIYRDPQLSTFVIGIAFILLFIPVGIYFLQSARKQAGYKAGLNAASIGAVYVGVGFLTSFIELWYDQVLTKKSAIADLIFFVIMFLVLLWPHRLKSAKTA